MATDDDVRRELREDVEAEGFVERLAERVGARATARAVFGEPVERGEVTVVPVARATWGFGGGSGGDIGHRGGGGGGGGLVTPLGYIEMRATGAKFRPVPDPRRLALAAAAAAAVGGLALGRFDFTRRRRATRAARG